MPTVAIVDNSRPSLAMMRKLIEAAGIARVVGFDDPGAALLALPGLQPQAVLIDYVMPEMDGLSLLQALRRAMGPRLAAALVTGLPGAQPILLDDSGEVVRVFRKGGGPGPWLQGLRDMLAQQAAAVTAPPAFDAALAGMAEAAGDALLLKSLYQVARLRDEHPGEHIMRVGYGAAAIARAHGMDEAYCQCLMLAAPLHDIGMAGLHVPPDSRQAAARLRDHTRLGHLMLSPHESPVFTMAADIALSHHEWHDGQGYPQRLRGERIPLSARFVAVADAFDGLALAAGRLDAPMLLRITRALRADAGSRFDPEVVQSFGRALGDILAIHRQLGDEVGVCSTGAAAAGRAGA